MESLLEQWILEESAMKSPAELRTEYINALQFGPDGMTARDPDQILFSVKQLLLDALDLLEQTPQETVILNALKAFK